MQIIVLGPTTFTRVDDSDYERFSEHKWRIHEGYVCRSSGGRRIRLHREIMGAGKGQVVDHRDGDPLNNTASNLRVCTQAENVKNRRVNTKCASKYKGIQKYFRKDGTCRWFAKIKINYKLKYLGSFDTEEAAAVAYDCAAIKLHCEFACLNFPDIALVHGLFRKAAA